MQHIIHARIGQRAVRQHGQLIDARLQEILEKGADHIEGQEADQPHDADKDGDCRIFPGQHPVELPASRLFPAFLRLLHTGGTDPGNEGKAHIRDGGASVKAPLLFHLQRDMLQRFLFVFIDAELVDDQRIPFDCLAGGKAYRKACLFRMVLNQVNHRVQTAVDGAAVFVFITEILSLRLFLIPGDVERMIDQLAHALVLCRRNRHDRHPEHRLHGVYIHRAAVAGHLVHHIQGYHNGDIHLQQLHGQIQIPFDIGDVNNVDDPLRLFIQHKVAGDQLLAGVGRHGIDAGQVRNQRVLLAENDPVLPVHRHPREIADMLFGTGQLVEQGGFPAVLVPDQRKGQQRAAGQRLAAALRMEASVLPEAQMLIHGFRQLFLLPDGVAGNRLDLDFVRVVQPEGQFVTVETDLDRIAHRGVFDDADVRPGYDPHVQQMLTQRTAAAHGQNTGGLSFFDILQCHVFPLHFPAGRHGPGPCGESIG